MKNFKGSQIEILKLRRWPFLEPTEVQLSHFETVELG